LILVKSTTTERRNLYEDPVLGQTRKIKWLSSGEGAVPERDGEKGRGIIQGKSKDRVSSRLLIKGNDSIHQRPGKRHVGMELGEGGASLGSERQRGLRVRKQKGSRTEDSRRIWRDKSNPREKKSGDKETEFRVANLMASTLIIRKNRSSREKEEYSTARNYHRGRIKIQWFPGDGNIKVGAEGECGEEQPCSY